MASDLGRRLTVAAIGIPLTVAVTYAGGVLFAAGLGVLAAVAVWEVGRMLASRSDRFAYVPGILCAGSLPIVVYYAGASGAWIVTAVTLILVAGSTSLRIAPEDRPFQTAALTVTAALYVGGLLSFGVPLRETFSDDAVRGTAYFFLPVALTWLADTGAYFGGRRFGRRKMAPRISPNKTVEGGVSGLLAGVFGALAYGYLLLPTLAERLGPAGLVALGLVAAGAAAIGDLAESALKRECGVKDSSSLLPGHGGMLDRLDSLLWSIPVAYFFLRLVA